MYFIFRIHLSAVLLDCSVFKIFSAIQAHVLNLDSRLPNWSSFSAHSWTTNSSSSLVHLSWAFLFSEDVRRKEVWDDPGIEPSSTNWKDSDNESELAVEGDGLGVPRSLKIQVLGNG